MNHDAGIHETATVQTLTAGTMPPLLGETRTFGAIVRQVVATCRAIGKHSYVFVEDSLWGRPGIVTQNEIEDLLVAFDSTTTNESIDSTKGIFDILTEAFGPVPDEIDHDPKIYILYLATTAQGFFYPANQTLSPGSNKVEMLYIAADINSRFPGQRPDYHKHLVSHELLHLIHWGQSRLNVPWINEGCAEFASYVCGYYEPGIGDSTSYHYLSGYSNLSLTDFHSGMSYPMTFTFMLYLAEKFGGVPSISKLIGAQTKGIDSINEVLSSLVILNALTRYLHSGNWQFIWIILTRLIQCMNLKVLTSRHLITLVITTRIRFRRLWIPFNHGLDNSSALLASLA
jgi:hypothetical protein